MILKACPKEGDYSSASTNIVEDDNYFDNDGEDEWDWSYEDEGDEDHDTFEYEYVDG